MLTQAEERVIKKVIERLEGESGCAPMIQRFCKGQGRPWLQTWSISPLRALLRESRDMNHARSMTTP